GLGSVSRGASVSLSESATSCEHDRLGAVAGVDLGKDVGDMVTDRLRGQHQLASYCRVVETASYQLEYVQLAPAQLRERRRFRFAPQLRQIGDGSSHARVEHDVARHHRADHVFYPARL